MSDSSVTAKFDFIKSPLFRVIHADGVYGGMTPRGDLFLAFYSERFPIPTTMVHEVKTTGEVGQEVRSLREGRTGLVREVEIGVQCDLEVAKAFLVWFQRKVEQAEKRRSAQPETSKEDAVR